MGFSDRIQASTDVTFYMCKGKFCRTQMRLVEFSDDTTHDRNCRLEVLKFHNILDSIADKMDDIWQIEHCWNFVGQKLAEKSCVSGAITHSSTHSRAAN